LGCGGFHLTPGPIPDTRNHGNPKVTSALTNPAEVGVGV
jgi:hypothetical protein